ncbi:metal-dependent hydrolase [Candidatus Pacearchaeota archaeon]|nr:metal-dependent hydrolase [Candidatus Pacearchaeota archaeon]
MKTHLAIGVFLLALFLPHVNYEFIFLPVILIASILPDIDSAFSTVGKNRIFRFLQWVTKHRGVIHSFTLCLIISVIFAIIYPPLAFPFFLGYGIHLFVDSFTVDGIRPFWPWGATVNGKVRTGGSIEYLIFVIFCVIDVAMIINWFL